MSCLWSILLLVQCVVRSSYPLLCYLDVSENSGTPESSILIGFSILNHPFWGTPVFGNTHLYIPCWSTKKCQNGMSEMELPNLSISSLSKINIILLGHMLSSLKPSRLHQSKWWNINCGALIVIFTQGLHLVVWNEKITLKDAPFIRDICWLNSNLYKL